MTGDEPTPDPDRMARIDRALADYLLAADTGAAPEPAAWLARYPELRPELGELLAAEVGLQRLADPLRPEPGRAMIPAAPQTVAQEDHTDPPRAGAGVPDETQPASRTSADPEVTTDRVDGEVATAQGRPENGPASLAGGARVRYFGDYEIRRELGRGGMGVVYEARQLRLNRPVALKMIKAGVLADDNELRRFQNEAEAVALLDHAGIVPVYEVGEHDGQRYFSMKLVPGGSLAGRLDAYRDDPRAAAALMAEVAEAVHHAHMRGILHRDLKPANILVDAEGWPHVTDFGLAKRVEGDVEFTASGAILGTPAYMSPEQASGRRGAVTTASDVYGLGAILYALLTGRAPFGGDNVVETLDAVRTRPPEPPSRLNARTPRDLETIALNCLDKDPRRRYASAHELADDLRAWLDSRPIAARRVGIVERAWLWSKRNPWLARAAGAAAAALIAAAATLVLYARQQRRIADQQTQIAAEQKTARDAIAGLNVDLTRQRGELKASLTEADRRLAALHFERGLAEFDKGETGRGLVRLVECWRSAIAADDAGWRHTARVSLAAWARHHGAPSRVLSIGEPAEFGIIGPGGRMVLFCGGDTARLLDVSTGRRVGLPMRHEKISGGVFSPDGKAVLTGGGDATARLWDAATGKLLVPPMVHQGSVVDLAFSPDGKTIFTRTAHGTDADGTARLWDAATGQPLAAPFRHPDARMSGVVSFSPDGKVVLTGGWDGTARLWDAPTG
jgi:hypothetical protein